MKLRIAFIAAALALLALAPQSSAIPSAHAEDGPVVARFRGSYSGFLTPEVLGPFPLHAGVTIVRGRHTGTANFVVSLVSADPGKLPQDSYDNRYLITDAIGRFDGAGATVVRQDGDYYLLLAAGGPYELIVEQPTPTNVTATSDRRFSGSGQQVLAPMQLRKGTVTIDAQTDQDFLTVWLYAIDDLGGGVATSDYDGRIIDTTRATGTNVTVDIPANGLYFLAVETGVTSEKWSISVQQ